ncbi:hypothetical protein D9M71_463150 [compost metagenome]
MVSQVLVVGIPLGDPQLFLRAVGIPTNEHHRVIKVVPRAAIAGAVLVLAPDRVLGLCITIGRAHAPPGNYPQQVITGWQCIVNEAAFLLHDRHRHVLRRAVLFLHLQRIFVPVRVLAEDIAEIVLIPGRRGGAASQDHTHQHQCPNQPLFHPSPQQKNEGISCPSYVTQNSMMACALAGSPAPPG